RLRNQIRFSFRQTQDVFLDSYLNLPIWASTKSKAILHRFISGVYCVAVVQADSKPANPCGAHHSSDAISSLKFYKALTRRRKAETDNSSPSQANLASANPDWLPLFAICYPVTSRVYCHCSVRHIT